MNSYIDQFAGMGVTVKEAEEVANGLIHTVMTPQNAAKLQTLITGQFIGFKAQYVVMAFERSDIQAAVDAGLKVTRTKSDRPAADSRVHSKTVYSIDPHADDANDVSYAEYDGQEGYVKINGVPYEIQQTTAGELYEPGEKSNPERPVYFVEVNVMPKDGDDPTAETVSGYSVMNLVKSLLAIKTAIVE